MIEINSGKIIEKNFTLKVIKLEKSFAMSFFPETNILSSDTALLSLTRSGQLLFSILNKDCEYKLKPKMLDLKQRVHPECTFIVDVSCHVSSQTIYLVERSGALFNFTT